MKLFPSLLLAILLFPLGLYAQAPSNDLATYNALSAKVVGISYDIPNEELEDLGSSFGVELAYRRQLSKAFALAVPLKVGVIDVGELKNLNFVSIDLLAHYYPAGSQAKLAPYLLAGYGFVSEDFDNSNQQIPLGAGLNLRLGDNSFLGVQAEYRISNQELRDNVQLGVGYTYVITSMDNDGDGILNRLDKCPDEAGPAATEGCPDQDMDGIIDAQDKCPTLPGLASLMGCPDQDNDGVIDPEDECPTEAGPAATKGCPDTDEDGVADKDDDCPEKPGPAERMGCPDSDGDGFYDNYDNCPEVPGPNQGCPPTDTDQDGFPDAEDECPTTPGTLKGCPDTDGDRIADKDDRCPNQVGLASNMGCPEIKQEVVELLEFATQAVQFETGSAKLKAESYFTLDEIVQIMEEYPAYSLVISGHTDNVGPDANNQILSEKRAETCRDYLISKGIDESRITFVGYGETRPRASNETVSGRRLNRRVEFDLRLL